MNGEDSTRQRKRGFNFEGVANCRKVTKMWKASG